MAKDTLTENQVTSSATQAHFPSKEALSSFGWQAANFTVFAGVSTSLITMVQSPLTSLGLNKMKNGRFLPPLSVGIFPIVRFLYAGFGPNMAASGLKTVYVSGAKKSGHGAEINEGAAAEEVLSEPLVESKTDGQVLSQRNAQRFGNAQRLGFVAAVAAGEVVVTQFHSTYGDLTKLGIIGKGFNWKDPYNFTKVSTSGIGARFAASMVGFSSLCLLEGKLSGLMPFKEDGSMNHFVAGGLSGLIAAGVSFPIVGYREIALSRVRVDTQGRLKTPTIFSLFGDARRHINAVGGEKAAREVVKFVAEQLPLRMARNAATFALVCGVDSVLGKEPLARLGFFQKQENEKPSQDRAIPEGSPEPPPLPKK